MSYAIFSHTSLHKIGTFFVTVVFVFVSLFSFGAYAQAQRSTAELLEAISELLLTAAALKEDLARIEGNVLFPTDLQLGDAGIDVFLLQQLLNTNPITQVAQTGPGSPGVETLLFDTNTYEAVVRYQELYRDEILTPEGLSKGTGYVGPSTRAHLNTHFEPYDDVPEGTDSSTTEEDGIHTVPTDGSEPNEDISASTARRVVITNVSPYRVERGGVVTVSGFNFTPHTNTVHIGDEYEIDNVSSQNGTQLSFEVSNDVEDGVYDLSVSNTRGESVSSLFLAVENDFGDSPVITSVSPNEGFYGDTITITGKNFTRTGNDIYTSAGVIRDVSSSDGETLTFRFEPDSVDMEDGEGAPEGVDVEQNFVVVNGNGVSVRADSTQEGTGDGQGGDEDSEDDEASESTDDEENAGTEEDDDDSSFIWKALGVAAVAAGIGALLSDDNHGDEGVPFGGRIQSILECTCTGDLRLSVGPPRPATVLFTSSSRLYAWWNIAAGNWVLGDHTGAGATCWVQAVTYCIAYPAEGTIMKMGTSGG